MPSESPTEALVILRFAHPTGWNWWAMYVAGQLETQGQPDDLELDLEIISALRRTLDVLGFRALSWEEGSAGSKWFEEIMTVGDSLPRYLSDIPLDVFDSASDHSDSKEPIRYER